MIAHSMGSRALLNVMAEVADVRGEENELIFDNVVLTAPDIDRGEFLNLAKVFSRQSDNITLYAPSKDKVFVASHDVHESPRASEAGKFLLLLALKQSMRHI